MALDTHTYTKLVNYIYPTLYNAQTELLANLKKKNCILKTAKEM